MENVGSVMAVADLAYQYANQNLVGQFGCRSGSGAPCGATATATTVLCCSRGWSAASPSVRWKT